MAKTYYLVVEQQAAGRRLRILDDYATIDGLVSDAADYEAGEFPGRWLGALQLEFDASGRLADARPLQGIDSKVHGELASRPGWRRGQRALERWASR